MSMTKGQVLAVLASAAESLRAEIEARRAGELPRRIERDLREVDELDQARAAIASWPEPGEAVATVCLTPHPNDYYAHGHQVTAELQIAPGARLAQGDKLYAAPPSLTALLAELRGLNRYRSEIDAAGEIVYCDDDDGDIVLAEDLAAILSRYPEAKP